MTVQETKIEKNIHALLTWDIGANINYTWQEMLEHREAAIEALKEVEQYRALGTVEELKNQKHNLSVAYKCIEELQQPKTDWIPYTTNGELPCNGQKVWLSFSNEICSYVKQAWWIYDHFEWNNGQRVKDFPLAWQPFVAPQPYKKEGNSNENT